MSLFSDTVLSGGARLHITREGPVGSDGTKPSSGLRAHWNPLLRLVKDPLGLIGGASVSPEAQTLKDEEDRKQLLYLRMRDVGA